MPERQEGRLKGIWVDEDVYILGKPLNEIPAVGQACAPFEDDLIYGSGCDDSEGFLDVVVFL